MTGFDRPVSRKTLRSYRVTISGVCVSPTGKALVATLRGDSQGDHLIIREAGRRHRVTLDVAELYRRGLLAQAAIDRKEKRKARKRRV